MPIIYKPLVHNTIRDYNIPGEEYKWTDFGATISTFTKNILTPTLDLKGDVGAIVSGIPTAFARTNLFRSAINQGEGKDTNAANLTAYYAELLSEWKGFIACIALEYEKITTSRVYLEYTGSNSKTALTDPQVNVYEPKGAFGNMLFNRKSLWAEQNSDTAHPGVPFIDIIKYNNKVIGGTSPESLLFTSVSYKIEINENKPFVDGETGKFIDPLSEDSKHHSELNADEAARLIAYIGHLIKNISKLQNYYSKVAVDLKPDYSKFVRILSNWKDKIEDFARSKGFTEEASIPTVTVFKAPYALLFNHSDSLYGLNGAIYDTMVEGSVEFRPKNLLIDERTSELVRFSLPTFEHTFSSKKEAYEYANTNFPALYVVAQKKNDPNKYDFFPLPLSPVGLRVFADNIDQLLGYVIGTGSKLEAIYDDIEQTLDVTISLRVSETDRPPVPVNVKYKVSSGLPITSNDIILWPNFKSKRWNRYFIYSEIPHYKSSPTLPIKAVPYVGTNDSDFKIIGKKEVGNHEPFYLAEDGHVIKGSDNDSLETKLHIVSDSQVNDNPYKYEIYESNMPFKGLHLTTGSQKDSGFLVIRYKSTFNETGKVQIACTYSNQQHETVEPAQVSLGIDLGSTNTSVAYCRDNKAPEGFILRNHRVSLIPQPPIKEARVSEILFFPSKEIQSNSIKSVLTLHDSRRIVKEADEINDIMVLSKEVKGGFPCFETNIPVATVGKSSIMLSYPRSIKEITQANNLKWSDDKGDIAHMSAFLKTLVLQIYADLYSMVHDDPMYPCKINWAYPAAMPESQVGDYFTGVWSSLNSTQFKVPIIGTTLTVAEFNGGSIDTHSGLGIDMNSSSSMGGMSGGMGGMSGGMGGMSGGMGGMSGGMGGMSGGMGGMSGGMGGMSGGMDGMSGGMDGMSGGMGDMSGGMGGMSGGMGGNTTQHSFIEPDLRPSSDPIVFNFNPIKTEGCLTEACSVANYTSNRSSADGLQVSDSRYLTLCFDIGGSTTDISALCHMRGQDGNERISMVKQSSIRFAAQRVSQATKYAKALKEVLINVCSSFSQKEGLKELQENINRTYTPETAQYFFEQIVNILDNNQLPFLYRQIRANCPELMCVNLYVTGLIMYYAGQLAGKLTSDLQNSQEKAFDNRPLVNIVFAGKGSRIFEWFVNTDPGIASVYYNELFLKGMGGMEKAQQLISNFFTFWPSTTTESLKEVKYEVSKGLARINPTSESQINMQVPKNNVSIELIGEDSFEINYQNEAIPLKYSDSITPDMMKYLGTNNFRISRNFDRNPCPNFWKFIDFYGATVISKLKFRMTPDEFKYFCQNISITSYIKNTPEYQKAQSNKKFDYVAPIIILEGMKFYDDCLIKTIQSKYN